MSLCGNKQLLSASNLAVAFIQGKPNHATQSCTLLPILQRCPRHHRSGLVALPLQGHKRAWGKQTLISKTFFSTTTLQQMAASRAQGWMPLKVGSHSTHHGLSHRVGNERSSSACLSRPKM
jgi:hypothetical protein